jgi:hypothetical protein
VVCRIFVNGSPIRSTRRFSKSIAEAPDLSGC